MNNYNKVSYKAVFSSLLLIMVGLAFLQSVTTPFSFVEEGIYHLQPYDTKGFIKGGIYFGVYLASLLMVALALFTRNRLAATLLISFIAFSYGMDLLVQFIGSNDKGISLGIFTLAMVEQSRADDMMLFKTQIYQSLSVMVVFILAVIVFRSFILKKFRVNTWLSVIGFMGLSVVAWGSVTAIYSIIGQSYPAPIKAVAIALEYYQEDQNQEPRILAENIKPSGKSEYKTIVWIIDESIGGQYLSVNGFSEQTTPFLDEISKDNPDYYNYGVVPSIANCSASSNLLLRIGLTNSFEEGSVKELKKTLPTIFQYAKRAGFETTLIDAQVAKGQSQNHLSVTDKFDIDNYITFSRKHLPNTRDQQALTELESVLERKDEKHRFVVVVKWGAHWPYPLTYHEERFKPAAKQSYLEMVDDNRELIFNAYYNSLRYSVDDFLKELTNGRDLNQQIVFYTSDHGQSLFQNDDPLTHCHEGQKAPPMDEFKVPLMVFSKGISHKLKKLDMKNNAQEQLFPTTLNLMGYSGDVLTQYGPTLFEGAEPETIKVNIGATNRRVQYISEQESPLATN